MADRAYSDPRGFQAANIGASLGPSIDVPRATVAMTLEQTLAMLGEAEHVAFMIAGHLLGPSPATADKQPPPVGVVGAANEARNRAQRLVEVLHAIVREVA